MANIYLVLFMCQWLIQLHGLSHLIVTSWDVKNYEELEILPYSEINKTASHSLIDAGGRHKTLGSETKDFITPRNSKTQSTSVSLGQFSKPQSHRTPWRTHSGLHHGRGALKLGDLSLLKQTAGYFWSKGRDCHCFLRVFTVQTSWNHLSRTKKGILCLYFGDM